MESDDMEQRITLEISPTFMDTWTPLPDASGIDPNSSPGGKIRTMNERRQRRLQLSASNYKCHSLLYDDDAKQLIEATSSNDKERLNQMLNSGKSAKMADGKGRTALHVACAKGLPEIVDILIKNGADPNQKDVNGNTAFHLATVTNKAEVMTLLVNAGCKIDTYAKPGIYPVGLIRNRLHRLQRNTRLNKDELHNEMVNTVKLQQALSLREQQDLETSSTEAISKLTTLHLTPKTQRKDDVT